MVAVHCPGPVRRRRLFNMCSRVSGHMTGFLAIGQRNPGCLLCGVMRGSGLMLDGGMREHDKTGRSGGQSRCRNKRPNLLPQPLHSRILCVNNIALRQQSKQALPNALRPFRPAP